MKKLNIVILGCGNVAEHFANLMQRHDHRIVEIYHPEIQKATHFASTYHAKAISNIQTLSSNADLYIIAVKDNAIAQVANELPENKGIVVHTSGNTAAHVLNKHQRHAVFYPLQTFTRGIKTTQDQFPLLIECSGSSDETLLSDLAKSIGLQPYLMNSTQRAEVHLAAVFAANFTNHCIHMAYDLMTQKNYAPDMLLPLIKESINKLNYISPYQAQTGPAVRHDNQVIEKQMQMLQSNETFKKIYELMTKHIQEIHHNN
jgi:predicted short-subunit dehydrogenase-like oxidoreductase (DUF2520 family)